MQYLLKSPFPIGNAVNTSSFLFNVLSLFDKIKQIKRHAMAGVCHHREDIVLFGSDNSQE